MNDIIPTTVKLSLAESEHNSVTSTVKLSVSYSVDDSQTDCVRDNFSDQDRLTDINLSQQSGLNVDQAAFVTKRPRTSRKAALVGLAKRRSLFDGLESSIDKDVDDDVSTESTVAVSNTRQKTVRASRKKPSFVPRVVVEKFSSPVVTDEVASISTSSPLILSSKPVENDEEHAPQHEEHHEEHEEQPVRDKMIFLDRVILKGVDMLVARAYPTVYGWTTDKVKEYVNLCIERGGLGQGVLCDAFDKSVDCLPTLTFYKGLIDSKRQNEGPSRNDVDESFDVNMWLQDIKSCSEDVGRSVDKLHATIQQGIDKLGPNVVSKKVSIAVSFLLNSFSNDDVVGPTNETQAANLEKAVQNSYDFFSGPNVIAATCYLINAANRIVERQKRDPNIPRYELLNTQDRETMHAAEYNLNVSFSQGVKTVEPKDNICQAGKRGQGALCVVCS